MNPNEVPSTKKGLVMLQKINWGRTMVSSSSTPSALWGVMFGGGGVGWLITIDHDAFGKVGLEMLFALAKFSKSFEGWWPFPSGVDIARSPSRSGTKVFPESCLMLSRWCDPSSWRLTFGFARHACSPRFFWRLNSNVVQGFIANGSNGNARHVCSKWAVVHSALDMSSTYWVSHVRQMSSIYNIINQH